MHRMDAVHTSLLRDGYQQRVMNEYSYTLWRNAAASMMRLYDPVSVGALPLAYTPGMANPLATIVAAAASPVVKQVPSVEQEKEESMTENHPSPGIYQLLLAAEKLNMEDTTTDKPAEQKEEEADMADALHTAQAQPTRKKTMTEKNAKRNHPPAGPGLTDAELNRLIANERTTTFSEGFWRVTAIHPSGIGKLVEVLRVYENGNMGSWSRWTPARIVSFDPATHTLVVDPYTLDALFAGDERFYLTYDTDRHGVRPIVFNYDTYYNEAKGYSRFEPQVHYCVHFPSPASFHIKTHLLGLGLGKESAHMPCYQRVRSERALHDEDIVFEKRGA